MTVKYLKLRVEENRCTCSCDMCTQNKNIRRINKTNNESRGEIDNDDIHEGKEIQGCDSEDLDNEKI